MKHWMNSWLVIATLICFASVAAIGWIVYFVPKRFEYEILITYMFDEHPMLVRSVAIDVLERRLAAGEVNASQMLLFAVKSHADASRGQTATKRPALCELNEELLNLSLKHGADPLTRDGPGGNTALHIAVMSYDACSARWLVRHGGYSTLRNTPPSGAAGLTAYEHLQFYRGIAKPSDSEYQSTEEALAAALPEK